MNVQSTACSVAKPITSHSPLLGSLARAASHAAARRMIGRWRARETTGKTEAVVMGCA